MRALSALCQQYYVKADGTAVDGLQGKKKQHFIYFILLILPTDRIYELHEACKLFMRIILKYRMIGFFALHPEIRFFQSIAKLCVPSVTWFCLHFASTLNRSNRDSVIIVLM